MRLPFCEKCPINTSCQKDFDLFDRETGNKRIPPESFCKEQYEKNGARFDDFYKKVLILECNNLHSLAPIFPDFAEQVRKGEFQIGYDPLPMSITLMVTEKCNLKCRYCYEVFSGNMQAKSMPFDIAKKAIDYYMSPETRSRHSAINWDIVGGELFVEFDLVRNIVDYLIDAHVKAGLCPKKYLGLSLCSNGTLFTPEIKKWCERTKERIAWLGMGISLDGPKHIHDLNRCNSFDRIMENFDWWRETFPADGIKGTINADTLPHLHETVMFFVEELKLPRFYINPTFEGPWNVDTATIYSEELIKCMDYFLQHPEYAVLSNSNLFHDMRISWNMRGEKRNWCGSGMHMRAVTPEGDVYPCLRAATSRLHKLGNLEEGIDIRKTIPFFFYTKYNEVEECEHCQFAHCCPSCVMEWVEHSGDMFQRSLKSCLMTKARLMVSDYYCQRTTEPMQDMNR